MKRRGNRLYVTWKGYEDSFNTCINMKNTIKGWAFFFFLEPYGRSSVNVKNELDLSKYSMKANLKEAASIETSTLTSKIDLASLKFEIDSLNAELLLQI